MNSEAIRTIRLSFGFVGENDGEYPNQRDKEEVLSVGCEKLDGTYPDAASES